MKKLIIPIGIVISLLPLILLGESIYTPQNQPYTFSTQPAIEYKMEEVVEETAALKTEDDFNKEVYAFFSPDERIKLLRGWKTGNCYFYEGQLYGVDPDFYGVYFLTIIKEIWRQYNDSIEVCLLIEDNEDPSKIIYCERY